MNVVAPLPEGVAFVYHEASGIMLVNGGIEWESQSDEFGTKQAPPTKYE